MKTELSRVFNVSFFFTNILIPLIVLALYCATFLFFSSRAQLNGVNYFFAEKLGKYLLIIIPGAILTFSVLLKLQGKDNLNFKSSNTRFYLGDFFLLFLPLTLVIQYILKNQGILSSADSLFILIFFVFFTGIYIFVIPILLGYFIPTRTLMILGLAFVFTVISMPLLSDYFSWFEKGALKKQLMVLGSIFLVVRLLYHLGQRKILYIFIVVNLVANSTSILLSQRRSAKVSSQPFEANKLLSLVGKNVSAITPNVYLLVYDAYVSNETMLSYGIDNHVQEDFLRDQGFKLYPQTYSIESATLATMSKVLNASTEYYGNTRRGVSGSGITQEIFKGLGYQTYGLFFSDFMFRGYGNHYDYSIPKGSLPPYELLLKAIILGEFRFNVESAIYGDQTRNKFIETKYSVFEGVLEDRVFIYMHSDLPSHSQNSGACLSNETDRFEVRLASANIEMQQDISLIVKNDPGAIVIIAGDHGPYLTKNCYVTTDIYDISEISRLDIQDRHATFLAIRWPTGDYEEYDDITVLQDLFPAVFAYLYKDLAILDAKIEPIISIPNAISGASVDNGIIVGGINDGEPLFVVVP